ncbi:MAG: response regulator transcription factor [Clostridia bacterium]|nr:response regulator transcription factor [Clostridia bacterium]
MALIYLVEDDSDIRELETYALQNSDLEVQSFTDSTELYEALGKRIPDLVLLDIMLPGEDGMSILKHLRSDSETKTVPIIMVTAKTTEADKVSGLDTGADDYITKPFGVTELVSRVKALLRRTSRDFSAGAGMILRYDPIVMNIETHRVTVHDEPVELTFKEFELLKFLLQNKGTVVTRSRLMDTVWGFAFAGETRTVDMHIKTLRQKLGEAGHLIITIRNVGYRLGE